MKQHWTRRIRSENEELRQANARLTALPDTTPPICATFLRGARNQTTGHGCMVFGNFTISGCFTEAEMLQRANRAPVFDITSADKRLWRILDLPTVERAAAFRAIFCPELVDAPAGDHLSCQRAG